MFLRGRKLMALMGATLALGLVAGCGDDDEPEGGTTATEESTPAEGGGGTIKVGVLSDCEGAFGSFFEPTASGFNLALIRSAGGKAAGEKPTDGVTAPRSATRRSRSSATAVPTTPPTRRSRRPAA